MSGSSGRLIAWPGRELRRTLPLCAAFAALFAFCYGGASWWASRFESLPAWDLPLETRVPFVPTFAIVYLTITPALMIVPFVFRTRAALMPLFATLCIETLIATALFVAVPQSTAFARPPVTGWIGAILNAADTFNLQYNEFPSLHAAFAATVAWAFGRRCGGLGRFLWPAWSVAVAASALFIHEHHLVDLAGGFVLAFACVRLVFIPLERPASRELLWVELCCLRQCARFSARHARYFVIFLAIYVPSLARWRERRVVRVAFCAAQWIDDLLDGDRASPREPLEVVDSLLGQMERREFGSEPLSRLTRALFAELDTVRGTIDDPHADFIALVREMRRDRERVLARAIWTEDELDGHLHRTFHLSVNLMLIAARCEARAADIPSLIDALGWCSTFRDLDDDLAHGLINVPRAVWERAHVTDGAPSLRSLESSPAFRAWIVESHDRAKAALARSAGEIATLSDARGRAILQRFHDSVVRFARLHRRAKAAIFAPGLGGERNSFEPARQPGVAPVDDDPRRGSVGF